MATSGVSNFRPTFDDLLQDAAGMVGGGPILAEELMSARRGLDMLFTQIQNQNVLLHKIETTVVAVTAATSLVSFDQTVVDVQVATSKALNGTEFPMNRVGFEEWAMMPAKNQTGRPTQYWFDRRRDTSVCHLWPVPNNNYDLVFTVHKSAEETLRAFDNIDVPRRFMPAIIYGLAYWIGMRRNARVSPERLAMLKTEYNTNLKQAMREDRERASTFVRLAR